MPTGCCRSAVERRAMLWDGDTPCPLVGRVSMDLITVDVTPSGRRCRAALDILGPHQGVDDLADAAGTIGYEILTALWPALHPPLHRERRVSLPRPLAALGRAGAGRPGRASAGSRSLRAQVVSHLVRPPFYPREFRPCACCRSAGSPAGGRPDRDLHRRRAGLADLCRRRALQRRGGGAARSSPSAWCANLGPVLGGLMVAARVASSIAAEIGTMKVTEQIDALVTLSTNPMKYLTVPRVLAAHADRAGAGGGRRRHRHHGRLAGRHRTGSASTRPPICKNTVDFLEAWDVGSGLVKGAVFGFIVALMGCYHGMNSGRGAQGVGAATKIGGRRGLGADPGRQLRADRGVLHVMIELARRHTRLSAPTRCCAG